jgi:hypothetical protein
MDITYDKISLIDLDSDIKMRAHEIKNAYAELHKMRDVLRKRLAHVENVLAPSTIAEYIEGDAFDDGIFPDLAVRVYDDPDDDIDLNDIDALDT